VSEQHRPEPGDEDAAWRDIVAHYGDRPALDEEPPPERPPAPPADEPRDWVEPDEEDHFVPPPPAPVPRPTGIRLAAWLGLFGAPALALVLIVLGVTLPSWIGLLLITWFVGGFGYLVATMRKDAGDGWDDGAVL
jgi:hypothetical protein